MSPLLHLIGVSLVLGGAMGDDLKICDVGGGERNALKHSLCTSLVNCYSLDGGPQPGRGCFSRYLGRMRTPGRKGSVRYTLHACSSRMSIVR